ncbi:MAG: hypothetical protein QNJ55_23505 [Xenococcus sp. MO_188.B8]|nr:hypothetical protein [Xenococcus sp. MO_188.B8]
MAIQSEFNQNPDRVLRDIKECKKGVLYTTLKKLDPDNVDEICNVIAIKPSASFDDDWQLLKELQFSQLIRKFKFIDSITIKKKSFIPNMLTNLVNTSTGNNLYNNFCIKFTDTNITIECNDTNITIPTYLILFFSAVVIIILWRLSPFLLKLLKPKEGNPTEGKKQSTSLCLVIPCNRLTESSQNILIKNQKLSADDTKRLIKESIYFLAKDNNNIGQYISKLNLNDEWKNFPEDSELYIQLLVPNGKEMINVDLKWSLSKKVPQEVDIDIERIALLNNFDNLEYFTRS